MARVTHNGHLLALSINEITENKANIEYWQQWHWSKVAATSCKTLEAFIRCPTTIGNNDELSLCTKSHFKALPWHRPCAMKLEVSVFFVVFGRSSIYINTEQLHYGNWFDAAQMSISMNELMNQPITQSINHMSQTNQRLIMAETKLSLHVYCRQYQTVMFLNDA